VNGLEFLSKVSDYGLDDLGLIPRTEGISLLRRILTGSWAHAGTEVPGPFLPEIKRPERDVNHSFPSSVEVKNA
jgi:hypothetical protein